MPTINPREYYPFLKENQFAKVSDEIAITRADGMNETGICPTIQAGLKNLRHYFEKKNGWDDYVRHCRTRSRAAGNPPA